MYCFIKTYDVFTGDLQSVHAMSVETTKKKNPEWTETGTRFTIGQLTQLTYN
jgi:hypothetical protein